MTAGSVAVPTIVPLRPPGSELRKNIEYTTKIELASGDLMHSNENNNSNLFIYWLF